MPFRGSLTFPGDKSLSHRAAILAALAEGTSTIENFLDASDTMNTLHAMEALGAKVVKRGVRHFEVTSPGLRGLKSPKDTIDCGNSGTGSRLLLGLLAGIEGVSAVIDGDASLRTRPMRRVTEPLERLGARFTWLGEKDCLPVRVTGTRLNAIQFREVLGSAQVKSAVILAALASGCALHLEEPIASRDHTENMLRFAGVDVRREGAKILIAPGSVVQPRNYKIWGDISSAAFFAVGACLLKDSELLLRGVLLNPFRDRYLYALQEMGASLTILPQSDESGEKGGDVLVRHSALRGIHLTKESIPSLIDELPILTVAGAFASGTFSFRDAKELRVKESDRIGLMVENLRRLGVPVEEFEDGLSLEGQAQRKLSGRVETHMDHRMVMSFEIASLAAESPLQIEGKEWVETSFPSFYESLAQVQSLKKSGISLRTVTIDGPAGSGKSTVAGLVAKALRMNQLDSGALYRAFTFVASREFLKSGSALPWAKAVEQEAALRDFLSSVAVELRFDEEHRQRVFVEGTELTHELRSVEVTERIKPIADALFIRERVRQILVEASKKYALVADGRDMGSEVFTEAEFKFFLTADVQTRASRRLAEFQAKNPTITLEEVAAQIANRDKDDMSRPVGALKPAPEAIFIDTSSQTQNEVASTVLAYISCQGT